MSANEGREYLILPVTLVVGFISIGVGTGYGFSFVLPMWAAILLGVLAPIFVFLTIAFIGLCLLIWAISPFIIMAFDTFVNGRLK